MVVVVVWWIVCIVWMCVGVIVEIDVVVGFECIELLVCFGFECFVCVVVVVWMFVGGVYV